MEYHWPGEIGIDTAEIKFFFALLRKVMEDNNLLNQPGKVSNVDESGLQLNNKGNEKIIAMKGSKTIPQATSGEK
jgi:hypothetical protein